MYNKNYAIYIYLVIYFIINYILLSMERNSENKQKLIDTNSSL